MPEFKKTTIPFESIHQLIDMVVHDSKKVMDKYIYFQTEKIRIAIPQPLLKLLIDEYTETFKMTPTVVAPFKYKGITIIENYQFNVTVFHVDWYIMNKPELVQTFEIKSM